MFGKKHGSYYHTKYSILNKELQTTEVYDIEVLNIAYIAFATFSINVCKS